MADFVKPGVSDGGTPIEPNDRTVAIGDRPASLAVVERLASLTNRDPTELSPLYESIDPDALDALVDSLTTPQGEISFTHAGYAVTVRGNGTVTVAPSDE